MQLSENVDNLIFRFLAFYEKLSQAYYYGAAFSKQVEKNDPL
jgi:uncharacterized PurR-regulated membrane protein YhhQ (DUF165 family)